MNQSEQESLGSIQTRVSHLEQGLVGLSKDVREGFSQIARQSAEQAASFNAQFQSQAARFEQDRRPQWQAYGVMLTGMVILGTLAYWPIREQQTRLESLIVKMDETKIDATTYAVGAERAKESRQSMEKAVDLINAKMVPFDVHKIQWDAQAAANANLQMQITELKKAQGDTWGARDALMETKSRLRELEDMVLRGRPAPN